MKFDNDTKHILLFLATIKLMRYLLQLRSYCCLQLKTSSNGCS